MKSYDGTPERAGYAGSQRKHSKTAKSIANILIGRNQQRDRQPHHELGERRKSRTDRSRKSNARKHVQSGDSVERPQYNRNLSQSHGRQTVHLLRWRYGKDKLSNMLHFGTSIANIEHETRL